MPSKTNWKDYITFSRKERNGIFILLLLILLLCIAPNFFPSHKNNIPVIDLSLQKQLDSLLANKHEDENGNYTSLSGSEETAGAYSSSAEIKLSLFYFDPNTLSAEGFQKLGLPQRNINTIINYRNKGGHFRKPGDIKKIYGLQESIADKLIPYIQIKNSSGNFLYDDKVNKPGGKQYQKEKYHTININTASEEEWKSLPGIGDVLSKRIVKFRNSIGGFTSVNDVAKTYGLADSTFQKIKPWLEF